MSEATSIMVDIETLGTTPGDVIVSIGATKFFVDKDGGHVTDKFSVNIDPVDSKAYGMTIDKATVEWWSTQPKAARDAWRSDPQPLRTALIDFKKFWGPEKIDAWCNGLNFDYPFLKCAFNKVGIGEPWSYWLLNDMRSIVNFFNMRDHYRNSQKKDNEKLHSAIDDCVFQVGYLGDILKEVQFPS